jgi:hypothetical protein
MYNAVVYHYFVAGPDLSLTQVLARETRLLSLAQDRLIVPELTPLSAVPPSARTRGLRLEKVGNNT